MADLLKKKLINEYDRTEINDDGNIEVIKKNSNIPNEILATQSIDGIVTDPENRTLWINGMPYGNAYTNPSETGEETGPFHAEIFNDFETNIIENGSDYSHVEGKENTIVGNSIGSHVEGLDNTSDNSEFSHIEGKSNTAKNSNYTHLEGTQNNANNSNYAHISGNSNNAINADGANISGFQNNVYNEYETAIGTNNWSAKYDSENGGDVLNTTNKIVASVGVGVNGNKKNAVRINSDGSIYLSAVQKRTDRVIETFDPCNYDGGTIYKTNVANTNKKEIASKSVQEVLATIGHMESISYWRLRTLAESNKLLPGKSYRITDYNISLADKYTAGEFPTAIASSTVFNADGTFGNNDNNFNRFDIIVTAVSESEFSDHAKVIAHNYYPNDLKYTYFGATDFDSWTIKYDFFSTDSKYDWVNTEVIEPSIKISENNSEIIRDHITYLGTYNGLTEYIDNDNNIISKEYYYKNDDNEDKNLYFEFANKDLKSNTTIYCKLHQIDNETTGETKNEWVKCNESGDFDTDNPTIIYINTTETTDYFYPLAGSPDVYVYHPYSPISFNPREYIYGGPYFYVCAAEQNDPDNIPTGKPIHTYNYKWNVNMVGDAQLRDYEFCLLTNEADFSYVKNTNEQTSNILFCKADKKLDITTENKNDEKPNGIYELPANLPYVIEITTDRNGTEYSAFVYDGPYTGNYGEITEVTHDRWYILDSYDPSKGIYTTYKDSLGAISLLVKREDNGIPVNFTDFDSFKTYLTDNDGSINAFKLNNKPEFIANTAEELENNENVEFGNEESPIKTIRVFVHKLNENGEIIEGDGGWDSYALSEYTYTYEGKDYVVWENESGLNEKNTFIISNPGDTAENVDYTNINDVYIIHCPIKDINYGNSITGVKPLEYYSISIFAENDHITVNEETMKFITRDFVRNYTLEYQGERYLVQFNPVKRDNDFNIDSDINTVLDNGSDYMNYRVLAQYTLNMNYTKNSPTPIADNLEVTYFAENRLLPITYVDIDINAQEYFKEGKFKSTGVIYRMIDEFGNDCPYDFKNIKFLNSKYMFNKTEIIYDEDNPTPISLNNFTIGYPVKIEYPVKEDSFVEKNEIILEFGNSSKTYNITGFDIAFVYDDEGIKMVFTDDHDDEDAGNSIIRANGIKFTMYDNTIPIDLTIKYSYTFDGYIEYNEVKDEDGNILNVISTIGDKSLTGTCLKNVILNDNNTNKTLPGIFFRLGYDSQLINNKFINCFNTGIYDYNLTEFNNENNIKFINNTLKNCSDFSIYGLSSMINNYFYESAGNLICNTNKEDSSINNSTFMNCEFKDDNVDLKSISINNSQLINCNIVVNEINILDSVIYNEELKDTERTAEVISKTHLPGLNINAENTNIADGNGLSLNSLNDNLTLNSKTETNISSSYLHIKPTENTDSNFPSEPPATISKYTQTFYYSNGLYSRNAAGGSSRDNGTAYGKSTTYTFNFNKDSNTYTSVNDNSATLTSGYAYSFPIVDVYNNGVHDAYFDLGSFYVQHYWDMYTWWGQSNAVEASGWFRVRIKVINGDNDTIIDTEFNTSAGFGGYWSQSTWSTYYITSYVNFNYILKNNTTFNTKTDYVNRTEGKFIISKNGVLKIKSIILEFYGETYANSTGANNCIGDVYISNVYRINGSIENKEKNTYQGSKSASTVYPSINYYKPSKYQKNSNNGFEYVFDKDAIKIIKGSNTYKLYVNNGALYFGTRKVVLE
jgi:hypothetical protein